MHSNNASKEKEGYIYKEGNVISSWKKRWLVLQRDGLCQYFEDKECKKLKVCVFTFLNFFYYIIIHLLIIIPGAFYLSRCP